MAPKTSTGFSYTEVLVAVGILGLMIYTGIAGIKAVKRLTDNNQRAYEEIQIFQTAKSSLENRVAWEYTRTANPVLVTHLTTTDASGTVAQTNLILKDGTDQTFIEAGGTYMGKDGGAVASAEARWFAQATWEGRIGNMVDIELALTPVKEGNLEAHRRRVVHVFRGNVGGSSCRREAATIVAGGTGGTHSQLGPPYKYDLATVQCPEPYVLTAVDVQPGCGTLSTVKYVSPSNPQQGICHAIAPTHSSQLTQTGCNSGNIDSTCIATCCLIY